MNNVEKIDAYFGNEMTEADKQAFEESIRRDPDLTKEFEFQKEIVHTLQNVRKAELKAMLNRIPISGGSSIGGTMTFGKIASTIAVLGVVGLSIYFLWDDKKEIQPAEPQLSEVETIHKPYTENERVIVPAEEEQNTDQITESDNSSTTAPDNNTQGPVKQFENITKVPTAEKSEDVPEEEIKERTVAEPEIRKPEIATFGNQENEYDSIKAPGGSLLGKDYNSQPAIDVDINNSSKRLTFHYQFKNNKLILYGDFDKGLYEILEINSKDGKSLFLYYKDEFFALDKKQLKIISLEPITNASLIEQLKQIRMEG